MSIADILTRLAGKIQKVFDAGTEQGKKSAYDEFWDDYQQNGNRTRYNKAFAGESWTLNTLKPKYPINPTSSWEMFYGNTALKKIADLGVEVDFSKAIQYMRTFSESKFVEIEIPITSQVTTYKEAFYNCQQLERIALLTSKANTDFANAFYMCLRLKDVRFDGVITMNIDTRWSPLNKESIMSIVEHLMDDPDYHHTLTLNRTAVNTAFETAAGAADGENSAEWLEIVADQTGKGWTVTLG